MGGGKAAKIRLDEDLFHRALAHATAFMMYKNDDSDGGGNGGDYNVVEIASS